MGDSLCMTIGRYFKTEIVTQRIAGVFGAEQSALLQHRHHLFSEILQTVRQDAVDDEAIGCACLEPCLYRVGNLIGRADEVAAGREKRRATSRRLRPSSLASCLIRSEPPFWLLEPRSPSSGRVRPVGTG